MPQESDFEIDLDGLLKEAAKKSSSPSADLFDRVLMDADQMQKSWQKPFVPTRNWWQNLDLFGGWQGLTALTACAVFGLLIGYGFSVENLLVTGGETTSVTVFDEGLILDGFDDFMLEI